MDAGACAAGRSSYATGGEGVGNQEWEWGGASNRAWATRRIHGGRCPVGRRSREDFARVKILTKAGTLLSRTSSQGGFGMEKAAWEGGDAHGKEATRSDKDSRRRRHYGSGLAAGATSGTAAGTFATGWAATAVAAPASAFAGSTFASSLAVTMSACASA